MEAVLYLLTIVLLLLDLDERRTLREEMAAHRRWLQARAEPPGRQIERLTDQAVLEMLREARRQNPE